MTSEREFQRVVKEALDTIRSVDSRSLQEHNIESRENEEEYGKATEAYLRIEPELSKAQREAVQRYIDTLQAADTDQTDNAYIAGIRDGIRFMVSFGLIEPAGKLPFNLDDMKAK